MLPHARPILLNASGWKGSSLTKRSQNPGDKRPGNRVALVTGAGRGNGFSIAKGLAKSGATLFLLDIARDLEEVPYPLCDAATLEAAAKELRQITPRVTVLTCDVRDAVQVDEALRQVEAEAGGVDILVNNAGVMLLGPLAETSDAQWAVQMDIIAGGAFHCCRRVVPGMNARGWGRIVNVASVAGHRGIGTGAAYTAAKHALIGLTRALAMEVAAQGITVNAVCPGTVPTSLVRAQAKPLGLSEAELYAQWSVRHLGGGPIRPEDVAEAVVWLASDAAARVNGTSLFVDDGWHAH